MSKVLQPITACFKKGQIMDATENKDNEDKRPCNSEEKKANKGGDAGLIWRMSSGLYNIGSGAVGLGVGSVKWAASTTYSVGTGVVTAAVGSGVVQKVVSKVIPSAIPKPKKE